jgi:hypothetical protein
MARAYWQPEGVRSDEGSGPGCIKCLFRSIFHRPSLEIAFPKPPDRASHVELGLTTEGLRRGSETDSNPFGVARSPELSATSVVCLGKLLPARKAANETAGTAEENPFRPWTATPPRPVAHDHPMLPLTPSPWTTKPPLHCDDSQGLAGCMPLGTESRHGDGSGIGSRPSQCLASHLIFLLALSVVLFALAGD